MTSDALGHNTDRTFVVPADGMIHNGTPGDPGPPADPAPPDPENKHESSPPEPAYPVLEDWVINYFLPMFRRTLGGEFRWCAQWWRHGEAISRLNSLWHAWEVLRLKPGTGIATWYREYLDHQLPILLGTRGPFYQCSETAHREPHQATVTSAPDDWWDASDTAEPTVPGLAPLPAAPEGTGDRDA
jgi:hypothetical protein